jgi:hypothetical protein
MRLILNDFEMLILNDFEQNDGLTDDSSLVWHLLWTSVANFIYIVIPINCNIEQCEFVYSICVYAFIITLGLLFKEGRWVLVVSGGVLETT